MKIKVHYKGETNTFNSGRVSRATSSKRPVEQFADRAEKKKRRSRFFSPTNTPLCYSFSLPTNFILESKEKILSEFSNSSKADFHLRMIENSSKHGASYSSFQKKLSNGEFVTINDPLKVLKVIDDLSSGQQRTLIRTPNSGLDKVFRLLDAYRFLHPKAMAVGFIDKPEQDFLIIANSKLDYLKIRKELLKGDFSFVEWFIARDVLDLLNKIFSQVHLHPQRPIPKFLSCCELGVVDCCQFPLPRACP